MKSIVLMLLAVGCSYFQTKNSIDSNRLPESLAGTNACYALYDFKNEKMVEVYNQERCKVRTSPCSTFKVPLALIGFEEGIFKSPKDRPYKWDGKKRMLDAWNKDQTVKSWMEFSVVWFSQRLTKEIGQAKLQSYLDKFHYGNHDFSGGVENSWLTPDPFSLKNPSDTVKISAFEQIAFFKDLYSYKLRASLNAMTMTQSILTSEVSANGSVLTGKTGSGLLGKRNELRLGWYVAHLKAGNDEYLVVVTFDDKKQLAEKSFGGMVARDAMKDLLASKGLW